MDKITYPHDILYSVIKKKHVKKYNEQCAARSLLIPRKITNSPHNLTKRSNTFAQCVPNKTKSNTESGIVSCHTGSDIIYGNAFSGGLSEINNTHPSTRPNTICSFNAPNTSGVVNALNISVTQATSGAPPRYRAAYLMENTPAVLMNNSDTHRLNMEKLERIWQVKQELNTVREELDREILRNAGLRKLILQNDETFPRRQKHLHSPTHQAATADTPYQCQICALWADYHKLLAETEASTTQPNTFIRDHDGQYLNSNVVILTFAAMLHYLIKKDTDNLLDRARPNPQDINAGEPDVHCAAISAVAGAKPADAPQRYELLRIIPEYMEKTWRIKHHIMALIGELNNELALNTRLRQLIRQYPGAHPSLRHVHTFTLQTKQLNEPQDCGICLLWTNYNNFFTQIGTLKTQHYSFTEEQDIRYRNMNSKVFKLTHMLLTTLREDKVNLLDSLPRHAITSRGAIASGMRNISWADITAAINVDPPVSIPADDFTGINLAEMGKKWNIKQHISRIKHEFADVLSLNFRLRQQLAQYLGPRASGMHFHTDKPDLKDFNNFNHCNFCNLSLNYNLFFNHKSRSEAQFATFISNNNHRNIENQLLVFSLTNILLTHLKKDTQVLRDSMLSYTVEY